MSDVTRPDPATEDTLARTLTELGLDDLHGWRCAYPDMYGPCECVTEFTTDLLSTEHAPTVAAALAATPHGRQAMLTALGLNQPRHCRNCGWDVTVEP